MNTRLLTILFGLSLFGSCKQSVPNTGNDKSQLLDTKLAPNDNLAFQRTFPDAAFDFRAYQRALQEITSQVATRNRFPGFAKSWTTQGPGNIGSRVNSLAVHPANADIIYAGLAHGGVFKTMNGGGSWEPIFDDQPFLSIGIIEISTLDPSTLFVGTGDVNVPGGFFIGDGVYRSQNGGQTWQNIGLKEAGIISSIKVKPNNPEVIFAATMGIPSIKDNNRGLFKSTDGGRTWRNVLFVSTTTGVIDLVINPGNPEVMFASTWDRYRTNFESYVSGNNGAIWKSIDGGETWRRLETGLPKAEMGRVGLTMYPNNPNLLYAVYVNPNSELEGVFKTTNAGETWTQVATIEDFEVAGDSNPLGGFGWYFGKIRVNPFNPDQIFVLGVDLWRSDDAGETWQLATPPWWEYSVHADKHDLDFLNEDSYILGTDGGIYSYQFSTDTWTDIENLTTTQFYRVAYNPHLPDFYFGGAQDNGTSGGNARVINDWNRLWGGDGFQAVFHPTEPLIFYYETQNGNIACTSDGGLTMVPGDEGLENDRNNWDMPYMMSYHNPEILYAGTFRLMMSASGTPPKFFPVSPDLTGGIQTRYYNISALDESHHEQGLVYVGTSSGKVWHVQAFDSIITEVTGSLPTRYVTSVKTSPNLENWVYVTHSGYKYNEYIPRIHRSRDQGAHWEDISSNLPNLAINSLFIFPGHADSVLFVGTDGGVYGTLNAGREWQRLGDNMPVVPVFDLTFNPVRNELVAGTYARSILSYNLDELGSPSSAINDSPSGNQLFRKLKVFPNPSVDELSIELANINPGKNLSLAILDARGNLVLQQNPGEVPGGNFRVDISRLPAGHYVVKLKSRHDVHSQKFVKH
jgi:photosystem II stability/assembly factor-like uncharacterized protein